MKIIGTGRNLFVVNRRAELFDSMKIEDSMLSIFALHKKILEIKLEQIYVCLFCKELKNITMIVQENRPYKVSMIMEKTETFEQFMECLKSAGRDLELSEQNKKITGYATAIVEKMCEGTLLTIIDKKEESDILYCPECGVQCDPNIPYCMECGAMIG